MSLPPTWDDGSRPEAVNEPSMWDHDGVIEIELDGPGDRHPDAVATAGVPTRTHRQQPEWRKVVGLSSIAGVVLGVAIITVITAGGGADDGEATDTTLDPQIVASQITAPPTLPPFTAEPETPTTTPPAPPAPADEGPTGASTAYTALTPPTEPDEPARLSDPELVMLDGGELPQFDIAALSFRFGEFELDPTRLTLDAPVRTVVSFGGADQADDGFIVAAYDPAADRFSAAPSDVFDRALVLDLADGQGYVNDGPTWQAEPIESLPDVSGLTPREYIAAMSLGPLRATTFDKVDIVSGPFVRLPSGEFARELRFTVPTAVLPEWDVLYDRGSSRSESASSTASFRAFVARDGSLRRVDGVHQVGATTFHTVFAPTFGEPLEIALPGAETTSGSAVARAIPGPSYDDIAGRAVSWNTVVDGLARFVAPAAVSIGEWHHDGVTTTELQVDRRTRGVRAARTSTLSVDDDYVEVVRTPTGGPTFSRTRRDGPWSLLNGPSPIAIESRWLEPIVDIDTLRSAVPPKTTTPVDIGGSVAHRVPLLLAPDEFESGELGFGAAPGLTTFVDVLVDLDGELVGLVVVAFDELGRPFSIEQRFDHDAVVNIDLPTLDA